MGRVILNRSIGGGICAYVHEMNCVLGKFNWAYCKGMSKLSGINIDVHKITQTLTVCVSRGV